MRSRLVTLLAVLIAAAGLTLTAVRLVAHCQHPGRGARVPVPQPGVLPRRLRGRVTARFRADRGFTHTVSRQPNLVGYFSGWAQPFASGFASKLRAHGIIPFVQIDPTYASVPAIAAGEYDDYLHSYAFSVRNFGHAVVIGFGHEMNAPWYSWGTGTSARPSSSRHGGTS